jgi:hypothetical protein
MVPITSSREPSTPGRRRDTVMNLSQGFDNNNKKRGALYAHNPDDDDDENDQSAAAVSVAIRGDEEGDEEQSISLSTHASDSSRHQQKDRGARRTRSSRTNDGRSSSRLSSRQQQQQQQQQQASHHSLMLDNSAASYNTEMMEEDRSVQSSASSRRSLLSAGLGRHRLTSSSRKNISQDSILGLSAALTSAIAGVNRNNNNNNNDDEEEELLEPPPPPPVSSPSVQESQKNTRNRQSYDRIRSVATGRRTETATVASGESASTDRRRQLHGSTTPSTRRHHSMRTENRGRSAHENPQRKRSDGSPPPQPPSTTRRMHSRQQSPSRPRRTKSSQLQLVAPAGSSPTLTSTKSTSSVGSIADMASIASSQRTGVSGDSRHRLPSSRRTQSKNDTGEIGNKMSASHRDQPQTRRRSSGAAKARSRSASRTRPSRAAAVRPNSGGATDDKTMEQRKATARAAAQAASAVALVKTATSNQRKATAQQAAEAAQAKTSRQAADSAAEEVANKETKMRGAQRTATTATAAAKAGNARVRPAPPQNSILSPGHVMRKSASDRMQQHQHHRKGEKGDPGSADHRHRHSGDHTTGMSNSSGRRHTSSRKMSSMSRSNPESRNSTRRSGLPESAVLFSHSEKADAKHSRKHSGDSTSRKEPLDHQRRHRQQQAPNSVSSKSIEREGKQDGWNDSFMVVSKQAPKKKDGPLFNLIPDQNENITQPDQCEALEESPFLVDADPLHTELEDSDLSDSRGTLSDDESSIHSGSDQDHLHGNGNMDDNDGIDGTIGDFANFERHQDDDTGKKSYATSEDDEEDDDEEESYGFRSVEDDDENKMGDILQFDPSQIGMVQRVKQIASDKKGYEINGQTMQIAEIVDPVSNLQDISISAPLFNLFDDEPLFGDDPAFPSASKQLPSPNKHKPNDEGGTGDDDESDSPVSHRRKSLFRLKARRKSALEDDNDECDEDTRRDFISSATLGYENPADFKSLAKEKKSIASKATGYLRNIIHNASHSDFNLDDDKSQVSGRSSKSSRSSKSTAGTRKSITSLFGSGKKKDRGTLLQDEGLSSTGSQGEDEALLYN